MSRATIKGYGRVEFDPMSPSDNYYELYDVEIVDPKTDAIVEEEHYVREDDYLTAIHDVYGRELLTQQRTFGECEVSDNWGETYICECEHNVAYVIDHEED